MMVSSLPPIPSRPEARRVRLNPFKLQTEDQQDEDWNQAAIASALICADEPEWVDSKYGDGTLSCEALSRNLGWCTDYEDYSTEARRACPRTCGTCKDPTITRELKAIADREPPRMLVAEGCDGSTAILTHAINILAVHGIDAGDPLAQKELLKTKNNPFITESNDDIVTAMQLVKAHRKERDQTLVFKSILHRDLNATINPGLVALGTLAVYSTRRNTLDKLVCMIRDCFLDTDKNTTTYGFPVDEDGKPSGVCFGRRASTGSSTVKAMVKVDHLGENLEHLARQSADGKRILEKAGYKPLHTTYEDVVAFEKGGASNVETSIKAWSTILASWNVPVSTDKLRAYLITQGGTYIPEGQWKTIYNIQAVAEALFYLGRADLIHHHKE